MVYQHKQAHSLALFRRQDPPCRCRNVGSYRTFIRQEWSPEQISGWMKKERADSISHERIYQYILKDKPTAASLYLYLRWRKKRYKRYGSNHRRGQLKNRVSIDRRPTIVNARSRGSGYHNWDATSTGDCVSDRT